MSGLSGFTRRDTLEVQHAILKATTKPSCVSRIILKARISHVAWKRIVPVLFEKGFLKNNGNGTFVTTAKGIEFIKVHDSLMRFLYE